MNGGISEQHGAGGLPGLSRPHPVRGRRSSWTDRRDWSGHCRCLTQTCGHRKTSHARSYPPHPGPPLFVSMARRSATCAEPSKCPFLAHKIKRSGRQGNRPYGGTRPERARSLTENAARRGRRDSRSRRRARGVRPDQRGLGRGGTGGSAREMPASGRIAVTVQSGVLGLGERGEGVAAVVGGDEFA